MREYNWQPPDDSFEPYGALYIHVPFCKQRCAYCDFHTRAIAADNATLDDYLDDVVMQIRRASKADLLGQLNTVYIGGGTPTHLGNKRLSALLYTLGISMHLTPEVECTLEANPESFTEAMVKDLFALGVTRLSFGVQSFHDHTLERLGRIHDANQARQAIEMAQLRFENISIDLMCGVPGQTAEEFVADVKEALALGVKHVSIYPLSIEDETPFAKLVDEGRIPADNQDAATQMMEEAREVLLDAGFQHYEVASYALPGYESQHNKAYWTGVPYMGLGPGAVGMMQNQEVRIRYDAEQEIERLSRAQREAEDLMLGMRLAQGVTREQVIAAQEFLPEAPLVFKQLIDEGFVVEREGRFTPTQKGWLFGNQMYGRILNLCP